MDELIYTLRPAKTDQQPMLLSSPHSGTAIPKDIAERMTASGKASLDTDLFVDELYAFGPALGITQITARYSRYVVDLNRDPAGHALYSDGRHTTSLVPTSSFSEQPLYVGDLPDADEIAARTKKYFDPYYAAIAEQLKILQRTFGLAVLWDCHSIKRCVPSIQKAPFPDVILGNQDGKTCHPDLLAVARARLSAAGLEVAVNAPFKGGFITRHFGSPKTGWHAIQLEMSQDLYMNEQTRERDPVKQERVQSILRDTLLAVLEEAKR